MLLFYEPRPASVYRRLKDRIVSPSFCIGLKLYVSNHLRQICCCYPSCCYPRELMTYRGIHSTFPMSAAVSFKQGYLHIKRERAMSPVTTRVLFKPWQTAYFILRRDPYILEEYKDASLKTQKQIHFIGTIKHVGLVRTSKSQQYAFEVVMQEKTPILLACENGILRDEWIAAFDQVMKDVNKIQQLNSRKQATIARRGSVPDTYEVDIIDTGLSERNNLHGDFLMILNPLRVFLLHSESRLEILSWPLSHITFYKGTPSKNRIIFVMSRYCHFGSGKLVFESNKVDGIIDFFDVHFSSNTKNNTSLSLNNKCKNTHSFTSSSSSSSTSESSYNLSPKTTKDRLHRSRLHSPEEYDNSMMMRNDQCVSMFEKSTILVENDKISCSIPNMSSTLSEVFEDEDTHEFISPNEGMLSLKSEGDIFSQAKITNEDSYIQPNEPDVDETWCKSHTNFKRFSHGRSKIRQRSPSDSEDCQTSYLQLNEDDTDMNTEEYTKHLLHSVTSGLEHPMQNDFRLVNKKISAKSASHSHSTPSPKLKKGKENRRRSEPPKPIKSTTPSFDHEISKIKLHRSKSPTENNNSDSPQGSPIMIKKTNAMKQNSFPKNHSITKEIITHRDHSSPFKMAEDHFTSKKILPHSKPPPETITGSRSFNVKKNNILSIRRTHTDSLLQTIQSPELDRNLKPKSKIAPASETINEMIEASNTEYENDIGVPPPVPERYSPTNLTNQNSPSKLHGILQRGSEIDLEDSLNSDNGIEIKNSDHRKSLSINTLLKPPPLPPKAKLLSSTKSVPLSNSVDKENDEDLRRSSFSALPIRRNSDEVEKLEVCIPLKSSTNVLSNQYDDVPPEIPSRDHIPQLIVQQSLSTSEGNILKACANLNSEIEEKKQRRKSAIIPAVTTNTAIDTTSCMPRALRKSVPSNLNNVINLNQSLDSTQFVKLAAKDPRKSPFLIKKPRGHTLSEGENRYSTTQGYRQMNNIAMTSVLTGMKSNNTTSSTIPHKLLSSNTSSSAFPKAPKTFY